ncbi:class C sortase [Streptococcus ovuberis]|uniref:Class C sortase n=1 Tax=Streptococcus ovuberis TaxID=1936207 RepID=A0A7X6N1X4_9STRE|nr:class C sortase [Streptococcus ovuberis]NKZ21446.1 class C sortase [Streptococcus ovuberis]
MLKKINPSILFLFIFFIGLSLLLYPTISDYWNSLHQSKAVAGYVDQVNQLSENDTSKILEEAQRYNAFLSQNTIPDLNVIEEELSHYNQLLNITDIGIMAYVEIPKLKTNLPIYHGVDESVLQVAIGHIPGTSLPVGGQGTHAVISGHRGLPSAKLFSDLDQMVEGDQFLIQVLDETLTYEVDQILTVTPDDVSALKINPERDYVTLVTCTPYGVNSHRLLVRGHRVSNASTPKTRIIGEATRVSRILVSICIAILIFCLLPILRKVIDFLRLLI